MKKKGFDTQSIHAGYETPEREFRACTVPVYNANAFHLGDPDRSSELFAYETEGHFYGRVTNPTVAMLEERLNALEGGVGCVATASGMAATMAVVITLAAAGDHIVASKALYGGNYKLLGHIFARFGIRTTFVEPRDIKAFAKSLTPRTKLIFGEILGNPGLEVLDIPALSKIAKKAGVPLVVDATFATPYLCRPFEHGADIVVHSVTKWLGGHGVAIGGAVIDSGNFDWKKHAKNYPVVGRPLPWQSDLVFTKKFGSRAFVEAARTQAVRLMGACLSPTNAFYLTLGLDTLSLRMEKHCANAQTVAEFLSQHKKSAWVNYPGLSSHPDHRLAKKLWPRGQGGVVTFALKGGPRAAARFVQKLKVFGHVSNVGDVRSLALLPAHTTQKGVKGAANESWVRLSIGLEDPEDLISDLSQAIDK